MPHVLDSASAAKRSPVPTPRPARTPEPASRFNDLLDRQTRTPRQEEAASQSVEAPKTESKQPAEDKQPKPAADENESAVEDAVEGSDSVEKDGEDPVAECGESDLSFDSDIEPSDDSPDATVEDDPEGIDVAPDAVQQLAVAATNGVNVENQNPDAVIEDDSMVETASPVVMNAVVSPKPQASKSAEPAGENVQDSGVAQSQVNAIPEIDADDTDEAELPELASQSQSPTTATHEILTTDSADDAEVEAILPAPTTSSPKPVGVTPIASPQHPSTPEAEFLDKNVDKIITNIKSDITASGGTMKIRLDPPNLGLLQIDVTVDDGMLTASFQTSNDEATRLLSHSMQQLKSTLESAGVQVDRIQVRQTSGSDSASNSRSGDQQQQQQDQDHPSRQDQQRREMLQKMWEKLALGDVPLDMVA